VVETFWGAGPMIWRVIAITAPSSEARHAADGRRSPDGRVDEEKSLVSAQQRRLP
jgi:hypothetical protein